MGLGSRTIYGEEPQIANHLDASSLKESLHIILMTIVFFDINQLHSLGYRQMITKEKIYEIIS